jgi:hypothetical protein
MIFWAAQRFLLQFPLSLSVILDFTASVYLPLAAFRNVRPKVTAPRRTRLGSGKGGFMMFRSIPVIFCACIMVVAVDARGDCARPALAHQRRDAATVQTLEAAWTLAYVIGDTEFEACVLTPDFTEIMSNGSINHLSDELALAEKNKGKAVAAPNMPPITVRIHGDVAVAYGISSEKVIDGKPHKSYFADYYVWKNGRWHVYFAQQTSFAT